MSNEKMASPILALERQAMLLKMEYEAEKEAFQKMTETMGIERRVRRGDAWWPVSVGRSYFNSLNQHCVEIFRQGADDDADIEHNFEFGRPVQFFSTDAAGGLSYMRYTGSVSFADGDRLVVVVPDGASVADLQVADRKLGVQLSFDETSYRAMFDALERAMRAKGRLAYLRDLFYSHRLPETFSFPDMHFSYLNPTQEHAVNEVLRAKDVAVVHGPPGTGKTTTLVEAIYETLHREPQVLVCAQSNMAVDWISEKLVDRGVSVLRLGNPARVDDKMLSFTYERRFEAHPDYPQLWALRKALRELRANRKRADQKYHQKVESLKSRATEIEIRINAELFQEARVIASTLVGSSNRLLDGQHFTTLFIDEAAQALEAACWIPMRRVGRVVLAGDHCQLPPTVKSYEAMRQGLGTTLMERIATNHPEAVTLLRVQYRMHEDIIRFSSDWFYGGQVQSAPSVSHRGILDLDVPMTWIDTSKFAGELSAEDGRQAGREEFVGQNFGRINRLEADLTLMSLQLYFEKIGRKRIADERIDVGIISPYRAQVQYLRQRLRRHEFFRPFRRFISVNTVDGFQGQERDIIVISLVRSNDEGQIGFLRDLRRMNVAITRARMKLIVLGDRPTLTRHPFYRRLCEYIDAL